MVRAMQGKKGVKEILKAEEISLPPLDGLVTNRIKKINM